MLLSLPRRAMVPAAAALAATWIASAASPVQAGQVRAQEWWLDALHVTKAWPTSQGSGTTVALLDTGVDAAAPDLRGQVTAGPDYTGSGRRSGGPYWGIHGTAMASLIAGHGHGRGGSVGIVGVAPRARILSIRVTLENNDPLPANQAIASRQPAAIAAGIRYAADHGAQVIDLPLDQRGTAAAGSPVEQAAVSYALVKDVVLVAPAGDDGTGANRINYPAAYPGVISVGAFNQHIIKAPFTNHRAYVTLTSAGDGVIAATPSGGYATVNSTSAASAIVAGMAALIKSRYSAFTPAQVTEALTHSTVFHPAEGKLHGSGFGTADAARALAFAAEIHSAALRQAPSPGQTSATGAAGPAILPAGASLGSAVLNDAILLFLFLLVAMLLLSFVAVIRLSGSPAGLPDEDLESLTDAAPQLMPGHPAGPVGPRPVPPGQPWRSQPPPGQPASNQPMPRRPVPGQRAYADAGSRISTSRPGAPAPEPAAIDRFGQPGHTPRPAPDPVPWQGTIRPPNVPGGPPWEPAPRPEGEPPPPSQQRPRRRS